MVADGAVPGEAVAAPLEASEEEGAVLPEVEAAEALAAAAGEAAAEAGAQAATLEAAEVVAFLVGAADGELSVAAIRAHSSLPTPKIHTNLSASLGRLLCLN